MKKKIISIAVVICIFCSSSMSLLADDNTSSEHSIVSEESEHLSSYEEINEETVLETIEELTNTEEQNLEAESEEESIDRTTEENKTENTKINENIMLLSDEEDLWVFQYTGNVQEFTAPYTGKYHIKAYGASGAGELYGHFTNSSGADVWGWSYGGDGGLIEGYLNLKKDETIYICVGQEGQNHDGGYNGGGNAESGFGGGGATSITTTNRGELKNFESYKEEVLVVSGGGGGLVLDDDGNELSDAGPGNNSSSSGPFGQGENAKGICGAGGSGYYGGLSGHGSENDQHNYLSGNGGSGYTSDRIYDYSYNLETNRGNGYAAIEFIEEIHPKVIIDMQGGGTIDGYNDDIINIECEPNTTFVLPEPNENNGYRFIEYVDDYGNPITEVNIEWEDVIVKAEWIAPLEIEGKTEKNDLILSWTENDNIDKYYKVYESIDGKDFYDILTKAFSLVKRPLLQNYGLTKSIQTYKVPYNGQYKLEVWGAQGGGDNYGKVPGGYGGYVSGVFTLNKGDMLYIGVGQMGHTNGSYPDGTSESLNARAYNGGGPDGASESSGGGGGATHIALNVNRGMLPYYSSTYSSELLLCAGGGGGGALSMPGLAGGASGSGNSGTFGWGQGISQDGGGGGAGFYGGKAGIDEVTRAYGGSNWINTAKGTLISSQAGVRAVNGYARITPVNPFQKLDTNTATYENSDHVAPQIPYDGSYKITDDKDNITVSWGECEDYGNTNYYKIESYRQDDDTLLNSSDVYEIYALSLTAGYYYYYDNVSTGTATKDHTFTESTSVAIPRGYNYIHVAAVDHAGNLSGTYTFKIPQVIKVDGTITWIDENNKYGYRPNKTINLVLKQNGVVVKTISVNPEDMSFDFGEWPSGYSYSVESDDVSWYLKNTEGEDTHFDIEYVFEPKTTPYIPPNFNTTVGVYVQYEDVDFNYLQINKDKIKIPVTLKKNKQEWVGSNGEYVINYDENKYSGFETQIEASEKVSISTDNPRGLYEIVVDEGYLFNIKSITSENPIYSSIYQKNGKWYLMLDEGAHDDSITLKVVLTEEHNRYQWTSGINNYFAIDD